MMLLDFISRTEISFPVNHRFHGCFNGSYMIQGDNVVCIARHCMDIESKTRYPSKLNRLVWFQFPISDLSKKQIWIQDSNPLINDSNCQCHVSFTAGFEDPRIGSSNWMTCVGLDTNDRWQPEMVLCEIDLPENKIKTAHSLYIENTPFTPQKNWLVLHELEEHIHMIHSLQPLTIVSVSKRTGRGNHILIKENKLLNRYDQVHGGACLYLEDRECYLVTCRIVEKHQYKHSLWILLDKEYSPICVSKPFTFTDHRVHNGFFYEICMSLIRKNKDEIYVGITLGDQHMYIYTIALSTIPFYVNPST